MTPPAAGVVTEQAVEEPTIAADVSPADAMAPRIHAQSGHALYRLMRDQLRVLGRIGDDPADLYAPADPLRPFHDEATRGERAELRRHLGEWLEVTERNVLIDQRNRRVLDARDFGAVGDGVHDDRPSLERAVAAAIAAAGESPAVVLRIPSGRYRMSCAEGARAHLRIAGARDLVVEGEPGTALLGTAEATLLWVEDCANLRLRGLCLDYERPIFSQGTITALGDGRADLTWRPDPGYPAPDDVVFGSITTRTGVVFDDAGHLLPHPHDMFTASRWQAVGDGAWRLICPPDRTVRQDVRPGYRMLLVLRRSPHGMVITRSKWVDLEEVHLWQAYHFASYVESSVGVSYRRCHLQPKPGSGRLGGLNADGYHSRSCRFGPFYEGCRVVGVMDDCFNLHARAVSVDDTPDERSVLLDLPWDPSSRLFHAEPDRREYQVGDLLVFIDPVTGEVGGWGAIASLEPWAWRGHTHVLARLDRAVPNLRSRESVGRGCRIRYGEFLRDDFPRPTEHFAVNMHTKGDGFVIRDCTLGDNTVTGGKIKASNGLIVNNHTFRHGWCCWSFANEMNWQEGFAPRRILVEGNTLDSWCGIWISTSYPGTKFATGPAWACRLDIVNNTFRGVLRNEFCIDVNAVQGCVIEGNELTHWRPISVGPTARGIVVGENYCEAAGVRRPKDG